MRLAQGDVQHWTVQHWGFCGRRQAQSGRYLDSTARSPDIKIYKCKLSGTTKHYYKQPHNSHKQQQQLFLHGYGNVKSIHKVKNPRKCGAIQRRTTSPRLPHSNQRQIRVCYTPVVWQESYHYSVVSPNILNIGDAILNMANVKKSIKALRIC